MQLRALNLMQFARLACAVTAVCVNLFHAAEPANAESQVAPLAKPCDELIRSDVIENCSRASLTANITSRGAVALGSMRTISAMMPELELGSSSSPILLIVNSSAPNPFGAYLGEILRAEGLNEFDQVELNSLTALQLGQYDVAILAQTPLSSAQASMFNTYVSGGGALLAMRPDAQISSLFGLNASAGTLTNGYLQIQNTAVFNGGAPGAGLITATLQIHGGADQYTPAAGTVMLARLYSNATTSTPYPAVVAANSGSGQAVAFTYDLPSNVANMRQGNPANANLDVDGDFITRTVDLFQTVGNPAAPWIDRNKIPIPQADEQQRLFARLVTQLVGRNRPLPQLWYFPGTAKTMLILTSDAHWNSMADYTALITDASNHQGPITVFLSDRLVLGGNVWDWPADTDLQAWQAQGDTFGLHPWRLSGSALAPGFNDVDSWFTSTYTVPRSNTVRIHQLQWQGWTDGADVEAAHNIGMDFSFYHWGRWLQKPDGTWPHGYITGSGLPMKFVHPDGTVTSVYQQLTELADDQLFTGQGGFEGLTGSQAVSLSQSLIDASLAGNYSALTDIHHVDNYSTDADTPIWLTGDIDYALSKGVPVWNADQWLSFTQTRHDANYTNITWNASAAVLSFNINMTATAGLTPTTILPLNYGSQPLQSVTVDGMAYAFSAQTIKSTNVAFVSIPAGSHSVSAAYRPGKASQTIAFDPLPTKTYGDPPFTVVATATSGLPVTFTVSGMCSIAVAVVALNGAGTCAVTANQSGNGIYNPAPSITRTFAIAQATPTVVVTGGAVVYDGQAHAASGHAYGAGGTGDILTPSVTFTYNGASAAPINTGTYTVVGIYAGNSNYVSATNTTMLTITRATPTITWNVPTDIVYGMALGPAQLNAVASVSGALVYSPSAGTLLNAGDNQTLRVDFTPADLANYTTAFKTVPITVAQAMPTVAVTGGAFVYDGQAHAASSYVYGVVGTGDILTPSVTLTYNGASAVPVNAGTYTVVGTYAGNSNYVSATNAATLTITRATQTINFDLLPDKMIGDKPFLVIATATSGFPVTFTANGECDVAGVLVTLLRVGSCTITAQQAGDANFAPAPPLSRTFAIQPFKIFLALIVGNSP